MLMEHGWSGPKPNAYQSPTGVQPQLCQTPNPEASAEAETEGKWRMTEAGARAEVMKRRGDGGQAWHQKTLPTTSKNKGKKQEEKSEAASSLAPKAKRLYRESQKCQYH